MLDAKTNEDITSKVLTQILLEYEPVKLDMFSNELLTRAIRVNDRLLKDFVDVYFRQAFEAFCVSQKQVELMLRQAHHLTSVLPAAALSAVNLLPPWVPFSAPLSSAPAPASESNEDPGSAFKNEAAILMRMVKDCPAVGVVAASSFAADLAEALRDASGALLREIDFVGEAVNLRRAPFTNSTAASASLQPSASRSIGESLWSLSRAFRFSTLRSTTNPGAMLPGLFFDAFLDPLFCGLPESISTPIRMPGISSCKRRNMPAHARASRLEPGGPALRTAAPRAHRTLSLLRHRR